MSFLSELRYPTTWYAKLFTVILSLVLFTALATGTISGFLLYRIVSPGHNSAEIDAQGFPGHPDVVTFDVPGVGPREGWFFPGLTSAPTILLCHGYQSGRGELLTLASALQDHQYNVFLFEFSEHGSNSGYTTLGFRDTQILRAAVNAVAQRKDVDGTRFGLWGSNVGGYAAMVVAESDPRVRAFVAESVYDQPEEMMRILVDRSGLGNIPVMSRFTRLGFRWLNRSFRGQPPVSAGLGKLVGVPKLYMQAVDVPDLAGSTRQLFIQSPGPREQILLPRGNYASMPDDEKRSYENRIVSFFLLNLPASRASRR